MSKESVSREHIITAFLQLCEVMPYNKITVSQLIKKAGYNRSTFYAHFKSIDDLMQELQAHVMQVADEFLPHGLKILCTGIITDEQFNLSQKKFPPKPTHTHHAARPARQPAFCSSS